MRVTRVDNCSDASDREQGQALLRRIPIETGWEVKQSSNIRPIATDGFVPVAQFPTVVQLDLLANGLIPDPYIGTNELDCLWINDASWTYRTRFPRPRDVKVGATVALVFDGLDTVVDVYLNGRHLFFSKSMFIPRRVDITDDIQAATGNLEFELELRFRSPSKFAKEEEQRVGYKSASTDETLMGGHPRMCVGLSSLFQPFNGLPSPRYLRKAQYHWGWDWGPALASTGPYLPIYLEIFQYQISNLKILPSVNEALDEATINITADILGSTGGVRKNYLVVEIKAPNGGTVEKQSFTIDSRTFEGNIIVENPDLWWPHTHGKQPRYEVKFELLSADQEPLHKITKNLGFRRLRLLQHPLKNAPGTSFTFEINNIPIFAGGSNWIPGDFFLPRFTHPKDKRDNYRQWLALAKSGNQNMIRVWGGGIVENDKFYNLCDELGLIVWQDLLFACGNYPAHDEYCDLVKEETVVQVTRIIYHPSLVLVCGDNEDVWLAKEFGWDYHPEEKKLEEWMKGNFQHRRILEMVLPEALKEVGTEKAGVEYWESSPFSGEGVEANSKIKGDTHIWDVWHGPMYPYQDYKARGGRFVSEFGFESPPNIRTIKHMLPDPKTRQSQSLEFLAHDKGPGAERRATMYMGENFRFKMDPLEDYIYCVQLLQAEAVGYAINSWRREFRGPGEEICSGALVWQLNDNWPAISWAIADYYLRPKPAFFAMKRALAPFSIGMERVVTKKNINILRSYPEQKSKVSVWATSSVLFERNVIVTFRAFDIESGKPVDSFIAEPLKRTLKPNCSTELTSFSVPNAEKTVVAAYLHSEGKTELLARMVSWPDPLKFLKFSEDPKVSVVVSEQGDKVFVKAEAPVKGLVLATANEDDGEDATWDDNGVDLVPLETVIIGVRGLNGRKIAARWLCDWETGAKVLAKN